MSDLSFEHASGKFFKGISPSDGVEVFSAPRFSSKKDSIGLCIRQNGRDYTVHIDPSTALEMVIEVNRRLHDLLPPMEQLALGLEPIAERPTPSDTPPPTPRRKYV